MSDAKLREAAQLALGWFEKGLHQSPPLAAEVMESLRAALRQPSASVPASQERTKGQRVWATAKHEWIENPEGPDFDTFVSDLIDKALAEQVQTPTPYRDLAREMQEADAPLGLGLAILKGACDGLAQTSETDTAALRELLLGAVRHLDKARAALHQPVNKPAPTVNGLTKEELMERVTKLEAAAQRSTKGLRVTGALIYKAMVDATGGVWAAETCNRIADALNAALHSQAGECCCERHHVNHGKCVQCPVHGEPAPTCGDV